MKKKTKRYPTFNEQKVACEILTDLIFVDDISELSVIIDFYFKSYNLNKDPFTYLPVTDKEYAILSESYNRQVMEERFGYYEE